MERYCGTLLPAVKSRTKEYECIAQHAKRKAELNQIAMLYNLNKDLTPKEFLSDDNNDNDDDDDKVCISSKEHVYPTCESISSCSIFS